MDKNLEGMASFTLGQACEQCGDGEQALVVRILTVDYSDRN